MQSISIIIGTVILVLIILILVTFFVVKKKKVRKIQDKLNELELNKNLILSTPVSLELSKIEPLIKNNILEEKYNKWNARLEDIKTNRFAVIDDMLIELDTYLENKDYTTCKYRIAKTEIELYKVREAMDHLMDEIKEITLSEEKYRAIVIKLKTKYRKLNSDYQKHKEIYDDMQEAIELQLENIEKRFLDFEKAMDNNEYSEVVHIVKALDVMIDHMGVIVNETPDVLLMAKQLLPKRMKEVEDTVIEMSEKGYPLEYLNIDYNLEESRKNIGKIIDKVKVLNLEDCMFELKTILEYMDNLFVDFEKERLSRKVYEETIVDFAKKLDKTNKVVGDVYSQMDDIKMMYDLNDDDIKIVDEVNKTLIVINDDYKKLTGKVGASSSPYSVLHKEVDELTVRLKKMEEELDVALKSLGNMYDDEVRAREQLTEIEQFLKSCKTSMRSYKLPIISNNYFVELNEANEAIVEVIKELEKKPIVIKTLNTRVDTARDLVLKLYNTTNEMIKTAQLAEMAIVYGNRYRAYYDEVDKGLDRAYKYFYNGKYKEALDTSIKATSIVDKNIYKKLLATYDK